MDKRNNNQSTNNFPTMLGQKTGSMLDKKTNEDFNNEHPDHDASGLIKDSSSNDNINKATMAKQTVDKIITQTKNKK